MRITLTIIFLLFSLSLLAQDYSLFTNKIRNLYRLTTKEEIDNAWNELVEGENIPLVEEDSVAFLYRGEANSVTWMGDFNGWGYNQKFNNKGARIANTDIWILKTSFPKDARLDYKIVINDANWILDPHNPYHQWSGVGGGSPNSELQMPQWRPDPLTMKPVEGIKEGKLETDILLDSKSLGYQITYSVYLPYGYKPSSIHPIIYVTDGYEYMHEKMGNMVTILDNLITTGKIKPVVAVFIDHREPVNRSNNRRMQELAMNEKYLQFITEELLPLIEKNYKVSSHPSLRGILGTSMGGLTAAYFAFSKPEIFGLTAIQSPAFWFKPEIYSFCENQDKPPVKTFLSSGLINDAKDGSLRMKSLLDKNACTYEYKEVNQGHSWGNWRDLIDDILIYFYQ